MSEGLVLPCGCAYTPGIDLPTEECDWHKLDTYWQDDPSCESCGRRGRAMVTATFPSDGESFRLCSTCGQDAAENGCEVAS